MRLTKQLAPINTTIPQYNISNMANIKEIEHQVLQLWKDNECFRRQNEIAKERGYPAFRFLNGPPFVSGNLHHGHLLAGSVKDTITRFWAMNGRAIERIATFDCLGLPAELHAQKLIGQDTRQFVHQQGIGKFNDICYDEAKTCSESWIPLMDKVGFWLDFDKKIMTMDTKYMETVWSVIAQLYNKDLIYRSYKVMPYSTGCQTTLSKSEASMNYNDVVDKSLVVKFRLLNTSFNPTFNCLNILIWTTTIWSLVSNLAVCVNPDLNYCIFFLNGERNIGLKSWVEKQQEELKQQVRKGKKTHEKLKYEDEYDDIRRYNNKLTRMYLHADSLMTNEIYIMETIKGVQLAHPMFRYEPLFDIFTHTQFPNAFRIVCDPYVKEDNGCGCVHIAPAHGEDDFRVCIKNGIIKNTELELVPCPIDDFGCFTSEVPFVEGMYFKDAEKVFLNMLKKQNKVYEVKDIKHSYPFCWRTKTPLIYKLCPNIFIAVEKIKPRILKNIENIQWQPEHAGVRYKKWMEDVHDWCISRSRYWGTPIPLWTNEDWSEIIVVESIEQLCTYSDTFKQYVIECERNGDEPKLFRQMVDDIEIVNPTTGNILRRIPDVLDCWVESACLPMAYRLYSDETTDVKHINVPHFIGEGSDQVRCWFAYMQIIGSCIHEQPAFENVFTNGLVLAKDGSKMSKSEANYTPPEVILEQYGSDALRLYLLSANAGESIQFRDENVKMIVKNTLLYLVNMTKFFKQMYELACKTVNGLVHIKKYTEYEVSELRPIDIWLMSELIEYKQSFVKHMTEMNIAQCVRLTQQFVENMSKWYINLSKDRFKLYQNDEENRSEYEKAISVLYYVMYGFSVISSPVMPFISEYIYQSLREYNFGKDGIESTDCHYKLEELSVHHVQYEQIEIDERYISQTSIQTFAEFKAIVDGCRNIRGQKVMSQKKPFSEVIIMYDNPTFDGRIDLLLEDLKKTINTLKIEIITKREYVDQYMTFVGVVNMRSIGKKFRKDSRKIVEIINRSTFTHDDTLKSEIEIAIPYCENEMKMVCLKVGEDISFNMSCSYQGIHAEITYDGQIGIMTNTELTDDVIKVYEIKRIIRFIQQMRKDAGLVPTDQVKYYYENPIDFIELYKIEIELALRNNFIDVKYVSQVIDQKILIRKEYENGMIIYLYV